VASIITVLGEIPPCAIPAAWTCESTDSSSTISAPTCSGSNGPITRRSPIETPSTSSVTITS
jgi:hypothetical protein